MVGWYASFQIAAEKDLTPGESPWLPAGVLADTARAPEDWEEYAAVRGMPTKDDALTAFITDVLTFPLTIFHALRVAVAPEALLMCSELEIHVLGAAFHEPNWLNKWGELLQLLPSVDKLKLVLIGPDIELPAGDDGKNYSASMVGVDDGKGGKKNASIYMYTPVQK